MAGCDRCLVVRLRLTNYDTGVSTVGKIPMRRLISVAESRGIHISDKVGADDHTGKAWVTGVDGEAGVFLGYGLLKTKKADPPRMVSLPNLKTEL